MAVKADGGMVKFAIVVAFYMHLKYDAKLFRGLFVFPLVIDGMTLAPNFPADPCGYVMTFEDGYRCQAVLDAVERSAASGRWTKPEMEGI